MTDPSPRAGFTVGSLAEVERSLLPLFPSVLASPPPPPRSGRGFSHPSGFDLSLPHVSCLLTAARTSYSITGNLSLFSRCPYPYLSFVLLSNVLSTLRGQWPRGYLRKPPRRHERFLFFLFCFTSRTRLNFLSSNILRLTTHSDIAFPDAKFRCPIM